MEWKLTIFQVDWGWGEVQGIDLMGGGGGGEGNYGPIV